MQQTLRRLLIQPAELRYYSSIKNFNMNMYCNNTKILIKTPIQLAEYNRLYGKLYGNCLNAKN